MKYRIALLRRAAAPIEMTTIELDGDHYTESEAMQMALLQSDNERLAWEQLESAPAGQAHVAGVKVVL